MIWFMYYYVDRINNILHHKCFLDKHKYQIIFSNLFFPSFQLQPIVNNQRQPLILKDLYDHYEYVSLNNTYCLIFNSMTQIGCVCVSFRFLQKNIENYFSSTFVLEFSSRLCKIISTEST